MATADDLDEVLEQFHLAQGEFAKGNAEPCMRFFSHREDVTFNNPLSPPARGWDEVAAAAERAAAPFRDGEATSFGTIAKYVTSELAYMVEIERGEAKVGASEEMTPWTLRATMIFRPEDGEWKVVHRHADPITTPQPAESLIQE
ncbi:MAG: nuclear transport factor 2 family protein [Actinomycetota bacterium]|nr:nuclear transport factor 2 family protein [Actinomycetota bacterium]